MSKRALEYKEVRDEIDFLSRNRFEVLSHNQNLNIYETYAERKKTNTCNNSSPLKQYHTQKQSTNKEKAVTTPVGPKQPNRKRKLSETSEDNGVALDNPMRVDEIERFKMQMNKELMELNCQYQGFLYNIYQKITKIEEAKDIAFEVEKNLKFQFIDSSSRI